MGKGDKKTKRGKLFAGSYGITRPRKGEKASVAAPAKPKAKSKAEPEAEEKKD